MSFYSKRGVSAQKEEVLKATAHLDQGLFPFAFCKIYEDYLGGDKNWVNLMHADGAGTKSILAYLYWGETGDANVWKGIARDAVAMNLDDLLCVGIHNQMLFSSTIDRNKRMIPGEVLSKIIEGTSEFFEELKIYGINIEYLGGETADVGDLVRTIAVNGTMAARWKKDLIISNEKIKAGDIIVGLASFGQTVYESEYNSGIGSNGLTSARHDVLDKNYMAGFPESFDAGLDHEIVYIGGHRLTDPIETVFKEKSIFTTVGRLLLSPTRTYAPLFKVLLEDQFDKIHGLIHCSGGGQTKCMKYLHSQFKVIKDALFEPPVIFQLIQQASHASNREMFEVFNMGHRMDIFLAPGHEDAIIREAEKFGIDSKVIGRVESSPRKELQLHFAGEEIIYEY